MIGLASLTPLAFIGMVAAAFKVGAIIAIALLAVRVARGRSAALRHWLLSLGIACAAAMPVLQPIAPAWGVPLLAPWQGASATVRPVLVIDPRRHLNNWGEWNVWGAITPPPAPPGSVDANDGGQPKWLGFERRGRVARIIRALAAAANGHVGPRAARALTAVATVWAIGALVSVSIVLVGFARLMWLAAHARRIARGRWMDMTRDIAREVGIRRPIRLLHSPHPSLLVTWGLFRPTLLLPADAMRWSDERVHIVLHHELAHIRRHDWAVQMCADLLRCIYWFNPLLWLASTRLRHESELACDDDVLRRGVDRTDYATHVLDLARAYGRHRRGGAAPAAAMAHPSGLERRIRVMLNASLDRAPVSGSVRLASAMALAVLVLPVAGLGAARAVQTTAALSGTVVDQSGAAVPSAVVSLMTASGESRGAKVDANGRFTYAGLPAGAYVIEVRAEGFAPVEDHVTLSPDQRIERRVILPIGSVEETMIVSGANATAARAPKELSEAAAHELRERLEARYRGQSLQPPSRVKMVQPEYPERLRAAGVQGVVTLDTMLNADGTITRIEASPNSPPDLAAAAREAVAQWRYIPTHLHGRPVETRMRVTIEYRP
jgi:TonB family protein